MTEVDGLPSWLPDFIGQALGDEGGIGARRANGAGQPVLVVEASRRGVVVVDLERSGDADNPQVFVLPWRLIDGVRLHGSRVALLTEELRGGPATLDFPSEDQARHFAATLAGHLLAAG